MSSCYLLEGESICTVQLEHERSKLKDDSNSEDDSTDVFIVISELKKDIDKYEEEYGIQRSKGFEKNENPRLTVSSDFFLLNTYFCVFFRSVSQKNVREVGTS